MSSNLTRSIMAKAIHKAMVLGGMFRRVGSILSFDIKDPSYGDIVIPVVVVFEDRTTKWYFVGNDGINEVYGFTTVEKPHWHYAFSRIDINPVSDFLVLIHIENAVHKCCSEMVSE